MIDRIHIWIGALLALFSSLVFLVSVFQSEWSKATCFLLLAWITEIRVTQDIKRLRPKQ